MREWQQLNQQLVNLQRLAFLRRLSCTLFKIRLLLGHQAVEPAM
jgi:hypothetical protein